MEKTIEIGNREDLHRKKLLSLRTTICSSRVRLVPYTENMIPKYTSWFLDEYICKMTSTDTLSDREARDAHRLWNGDDNKIIFIVLHREDDDKHRQNVIDAMIGDCNLVMDSADDAVIGAEVMVMIGEAIHRGKGLGRDIVQLLLRYGWEELGITVFEARISMGNVTSLGLFRSLGFDVISSDEIFREYLLRLSLDELAGTKLKERTDTMGYSVSLQSSASSPAVHVPDNGVYGLQLDHG